MFSVRYYSPVTRLVVLRVPASFTSRMRAAVCLVKSVKKTPAAIHVLQTAGSARTLKTIFMHWHSSLVATLHSLPSPSTLGLDDAFFAQLEADIPEAMRL